MNVHRVNLDFKFILRILPESIATEFKAFFFFCSIHGIYANFFSYQG